MCCLFASAKKVLHVAITVQRSSGSGAGSCRPCMNDASWQASQADIGRAENGGVCAAEQLARRRNCQEHEVQRQLDRLAMCIPGVCGLKLFALATVCQQRSKRRPGKLDEGANNSGHRENWCFPLSLPLDRLSTILLSIKLLTNRMDKCQKQ